MVKAVQPEHAGDRGIARGDDRTQFARRQSVARIGTLEPRQPCEQPPRGGQQRRAGDQIALRIRPGERSEEHTSELQSLMRISYAVFCLKKKKARKTMITVNLR